jgi:predicted ATP-grasp superfamily ATP-dependent carboligase
MVEKVLILEVENSSILPFLWYYHKLGYKVFAAGSKRFSIGFFSRFAKFKLLFPSLKINEKKEKIKHFLHLLKTTCEKYGITLVLGFSETIVKHLIEHKEELNITDIFPSYSSYQILHDKSLLKEYLEKIKPHSFSIPSSYELSNVIFPCIVKPNIGAGGSYTSICNNFYELEKAIRRIEATGRKPLIEEYIPFNGRMSINLLIDKKYKVKRAVIGERVSRRRIKRVLKEVENFLRKIRYQGFASPQFLLKGNELYLTEINPRLSAVPFGIDFGANFPRAFHEAIIEGKNIKKKFIFLSPAYPLKKMFLYSLLYRRKYKDVKPAVVGMCTHVRELIKHIFNFILSPEYRKWLKIFEVRNLNKR